MPYRASPCGCHDRGDVWLERQYGQSRNKPEAPSGPYFSSAFAGVLAIVDGHRVQGATLTLLEGQVAVARFAAH